MKKLFYSALIFICFVQFPIFSQLYLNNWQTYASLFDVRSSSVDSRGRIWVGTSGGVFVYDPQSETYSNLTNINGLLTLDVTTIRCNPSKKTIYIGGFDGNLDIATEDMNWSHITDIKNSRFTEPQINDILFDGDIAYVAGGFGLSVLDQTKGVFLKTPPRIGTFAPNTGVKRVIKSRNELWVTTKSGIAKVNLQNSIINPDNWQNYTISNGLQDNDANFLVDFNDTIFASSKYHIYKFDKDSFSVVMEIPVQDRYASVKGLFVYNNKLCFATEFNLIPFNYNPIYEFNKILDSSFIASVTSISTDYVIANLKDAGVVLIDSSGFKQFKPNCPSLSSFSGLAVDSYGTLWTASGTESQRKGLMKFENDKWENIIKDLSNNRGLNFFRISSNPIGKVFASSWGSGFIGVEKMNNNYSYERFDTSNSPLVGISSDQNFIITGQSAYDKRNGIDWIVNYAPNSRGPLLVGKDSKGTFYSFENMNSVFSRDYLTLAIDDNGTKWLGSTTSGGLYYFNEMNTFDKTSDDKWGNYSTSNSNLPNVTITALAVDKTGVVWIGTPSGLAVILNPGAVLRNANPFIRKVTLISQLAINDIMIDALNNKWIATNEGVWIINPDGSEVLGYITQKSSPLLSDEVLSLASDPKTGKIYFGTKIGLNSVSSLSIEPLTDYKLDIYPQPYNPENDGTLSIEGLSYDTDLAIVTLNGELVKNIKTSGRKAIWDGRNERGEFVSSGIFLVVTSSTSQSATSVGKFAVVR